MHARVDIICLVHNQLAITRGFVNHLFKHTENFRLIFVNNGSTDGTPEFLEEGKRENKWEVVSPGENLGVIKGRNLGAKYITADYFVNLDNDQYVQAGWLDNLFELMNKGYDIVGKEAWRILPPKTPGAIVVHNTVIPDRSYYPHKHCENPGDTFTYIGCGGCLIKKQVYDEIGLFDERFSPAYFEDPDWCFKAIQTGFKLGWAHDCPIEHLAHQTIYSQNLFNKNVQFIKSWMEFRKKWMPYYPPSMRMI